MHPNNQPSHLNVLSDVAAGPGVSDSLARPEEAMGSTNVERESYSGPSTMRIIAVALVFSGGGGKPRAGADGERK